MPTLRPFAALLLGLPFLACSSPPGDAPGSAKNAAQGCGSFSVLGEAVVSGAQSGSSTVQQVDWRYNSVVSGPIIGGEAFASAASNLILSATQEIIIESFLIDDTWITGQVRDAIAQIDPSIPVYVLVTTDRSWDQIMQTNPQNTANRVLGLLDPNATHNVIVGAWSSAGIVNQKINHDKTIIVDRSQLLVSNINMEPSADPTWASGSGHSWYQMGVILQGEIAGVAASEATGAWTHAGAIAASQSAAANTWAIPTLTAPGGTGCTPMVAMGREAGDGEGSSADQAFVALFTSAQQVLRVQSPNLNDDGALAALVQATNNVDVYIVLSEGFTGWTEWLGQGGSNDHVVNERLPEMLQQNGNPCHLHVRWYASPDNPGVSVYGTNVDGASHAKFASADSQVMVLGSQNMDTQSWKTSREFSVAIDDVGTTRAFDDAFQAVWDRGPCAYECGGCQ